MQFDQKEFGHSELEVVSESLIFKNLDKKINVWMSHGDQVQDLPDEFNLARERVCWRRIKI